MCIAGIRCRLCRQRMITPDDLCKNLEELENDNWGSPEYNSRLVIRTHELRRLPLNKFTVEDLKAGTIEDYRKGLSGRVGEHSIDCLQYKNELHLSSNLHRFL